MKFIKKQKMKTLKIIIAFTLLVIGCSQEEQQINPNNSKEILIVIREKTFTTSNIELVLNNEVVQSINGNVIQYQSDITDLSTFYITSKMALRYEYDLYEITHNGEELMNDRSDYISPLIKPFEIVTIDF